MLLNSKIVMLNNVIIIVPFVHIVMSTTCVVLFTITCAFTLTLVVCVVALDDLEQSCMMTSCAMIQPKFAL